MKSRYLVFAGMGVELIGIILSCLYVGQLIDERYHTQGLALAGLPMLGLAGWIYHIVLLTKQMDANSAQNKSKETDL